MSLVASRSLPLGAKGRLHSANVRSVMPHGCETWPNKEKDLIRQETNNARTVRWMCNDGSGDRGT